MGSLKEFLLGPVLLPSVQQKSEKKPKISDYACLQAAHISIENDSLFLSFLYLGAGPKPLDSGGCLKPVCKGRGAHSQQGKLH